ncbi:MAG: nucleotidyltransferase domain-containing protein [Hyphomonas sp.]
MSSSLNAIPKDAQAEIFRRLEKARQEHEARILFAIESGSRAWGFPSPDSDYDVRFVYVLPAEKYLSLSPPRDVIEQPIEGLFDINGWDLRKALSLLLKANPVLSEWVRSPLVYAEEQGFRDRIEALLQEVDERPAARHHHLSLLKNQYGDFAGKSEVKLKKYFYALRPAYALSWMWENPRGPLPMQFGTLRAGIVEPPDRAELVDALLAKKSATRELGTGRRIRPLDDFLESVIQRASEETPERAPKPGLALQEACDALFRHYALAP